MELTTVTPTLNVTTLLGHSTVLVFKDFQEMEFPALVRLLLTVKHCSWLLHVITNKLYVEMHITLLCDLRVTCALNVALAYLKCI